MSSPPLTLGPGIHLAHFTITMSPQRETQDAHSTDEDLRLLEGKDLSQDYPPEAPLLELLKGSWGPLKAGPSNPGTKLGAEAPPGRTLKGLCGLQFPVSPALLPASPMSQLQLHIWKPHCASDQADSE